MRVPIDEKATVMTDCAAVIAAARNPSQIRRGAVAHAKLWYMKEAERGQVWYVKTKAHRSVEQAALEGDMQDYVGNYQADLHAKNAAYASSTDTARNLKARAAQLRVIRFLHSISLLLFSKSTSSK